MRSLVRAKRKTMNFLQGKWICMRTHKGERDEGKYKGGRGRIKRKFGGYNMKRSDVLLKASSTVPSWENS